MALAAVMTMAACDAVPRAAEAPVADSVVVDSVEVERPVASPGDGAGSSTSARTTPPPLAPLADSIAQRLVFAPRVQGWFTAAARARRLVVDLGRVDFDLKKDSARLAAFREAATARSPFPVGTRLRLRGAWGSDDATIQGFDAWNGRIVATIATAPRVDSLARITDPMVASAQRGDSMMSGAPIVAPTVAPNGETDGEADVGATGCARDTTAEFAERLKTLAHEAEDSLRASADQPIYPRLRNALKARRSVAAGCFGAARGVAIVTLYAGDYEWVRERVLLVGDDRVTRATVRDLRFRAHEALHALDADGDGVDDLAARAWTPRGGGTVILRLGDGARFERLAAGFAWER